MHFYGGVFGWEFEDAAPAGRNGSGRYVSATLNGQEAAAITGPWPGVAAWNTYVSVDESGTAVRHLLSAGATLKSAPADAGLGGVQAVLTDPEGVEFRIWQARGRPGAQVVTVPVVGTSVTSTPQTPRQPSPSTRRPSAGSSTPTASES